MHLLGPTPMMLRNTFGAGPKASVGATNPGSVAQTVHRHKSKIEAPAQVRVQKIKRFEEPACSSERLRPSQRSKIPPREEPPLPNRRARQGARPPPEVGVR